MPGAMSCRLCTLLSEPAVWEDALWHVRAIEPPYGVPGWMILLPKRHTPGFAYMSDAEARSLGPVLRHLTRTLERTTGALRIYTAALGEAVPHLHVHLVPRLPELTGGWSVFDLQARAQRGEVVVTEAAMNAAVEAFRAALLADPPPATVP
jgi:diadenosine tetraphosphate (Ap4A) HIT family hydrolase